ncbi:hypothetical protein I350_04425 [Cryptococcus amylolentus CBS 6273]|uniref:Uncharacterized protein n=1 Tax=Cryptococcus amylolentus CBS 6273 TaxID=1296118 RepID=A0A1E3K3H1_9TREE|nr:hypothetical protein I350_04425 [Cryptococcus amylolentus CBS 6273]
MSIHSQQTWTQKEPHTRPSLEAKVTAFGNDLAMFADSNIPFEHSSEIPAGTTSYVGSSSTYSAQTKTLFRETFIGSRDFPNQPERDYDCPAEAAQDMEKAITHSLTKDSNAGWVASCFTMDKPEEGLKAIEMALYSKYMEEDREKYEGVQFLQLEPGQMRAAIRTMEEP